MTRIRYPEDAARVTVADLVKLTGLSRRRTLKMAAKFEWIADKQGGTYDARLVDVINAMRGLPHRPLESAHADWLARYTKENQ